MPRLPLYRSVPSRLVLGSAAAALAATTLLSGCGGSAKAAAAPEGPTLSPVLQGDPTQVVAGAAGRTVTSGNAGLALTVPVFQEGQLTDVLGEGTVDFAGDKLRLTVPNADNAEQLLFGRTLYVMLPHEAGLPGKKWVSANLDQSQAQTPDPLSLYAFDPRQIVTTGTAVTDAKLVGPEPVRGGTATHFTGTIDPAKLANAGLEPTFATAFTKATAGKPTPTDIWLDDAGLVRKMTVRIPPPGAALPAGSTPTATVELFDFNTADVSFPEPPPAEVASLQELTGTSGHGD
jgi:hypothetical protein